MTRSIFVYWHDWSELATNPCLAYCIHSLRQNRGRAEIVFLDKLRADTELQEAGFSSECILRMPVAFFSDVLRVAVLERYGGLWIDATTILWQNVDWAWQILATDRRRDFLVFRTRSNELKCDHPFLESSFLCVAKKHHPLLIFMLAEIRELDPSNSMSRLLYPLKCLITGTRLHVNTRWYYHTFYHIFTKVLQTHPQLWESLIQLESNDPTGLYHYLSASYSTIPGVIWTLPALALETRSVQHLINECHHNRLMNRSWTTEHRLTKLTSTVRGLLYFPAVPRPPGSEPVVDSRIFVACINMFEREDRYRCLEKECRGHGIQNVHFHRVHRHPESGRIGCFQSHLDVFRMCLDSGFERAIVFEDDVRLSPDCSFTDTCRKILAIEKQFPTWKRITLHDTGLCTIAPPRARETGVPTMIHARGVYTRCYAISKSGMQQMLASGITSNHIDHAMYASFFHAPTFAMRPGPLTYDNTQTNTSNNSAWGTLNLSLIDDMINYFQNNEEVIERLLRSSRILPASDDTTLGHLINYQLVCSASTDAVTTVGTIVNAIVSKTQGITR